jgi:hypothetical protein
MKQKINSYYFSTEKGHRGKASERILGIKSGNLSISRHTTPVSGNMTGVKNRTGYSRLNK